MSGFRTSMKKLFAKEMDFGVNYYRNQRLKRERENDIWCVKGIVGKMTISDVETIFNLFNRKRKTNPNGFKKEYNQVIFPLMDEWGQKQDPDKMCDLLYPVISERMCEESSIYSVWK